MGTWEFTGETKLYRGITLRRIRATMDFTLKRGVKVYKGENGGWIEKEQNLRENAWVSGNALVYDNALVSDDAWVYGDAWVFEDAKVYGDACVNTNALVCGNAQVYDTAIVCGNARVYGNARVFGDANVVDAQVYGVAKVFGNARVYDNAKVYGSARVFGNAKVLGDAKIQKLGDVIWFNNIWSSGRVFTYTKSNNKWAVGCFYGSGEELIKKAYADSELSGKCYEDTVKYVEQIYAAIDAAKAKEVN